MGAVVIGLSEKEIEEIYDVRLLIETFVFERLIKMDTTNLAMELSKTLEMMKVAIKYNDADEFSYGCYVPRGYYSIHRTFLYHNDLE